MAQVPTGRGAVDTELGPGVGFPAVGLDPFDFGEEELAPPHATAIESKAHALRARRGSIGVDDMRRQVGLPRGIRIALRRPVADRPCGWASGLRDRVVAKKAGAVYSPSSPRKGFAAKRKARAGARHTFE
jgi:hypothetical protein